MDLFHEIWFEAVLPLLSELSLLTIFTECTAAVWRLPETIRRVVEVFFCGAAPTATMTLVKTSIAMQDDIPLADPAATTVLRRPANSAKRTMIAKWLGVSESSVSAAPTNNNAQPSSASSRAGSPSPTSWEKLIKNNYEHKPISMLPLPQSVALRKDPDELTDYGGDESSTAGHRDEQPVRPASARKVQPGTEQQQQNDCPTTTVPPPRVHHLPAPLLRPQFLKSQRPAKPVWPQPTPSQRRKLQKQLSPSDDEMSSPESSTLPVLGTSPRAPRRPAVRKGTALAPRHYQNKVLVLDLDDTMICSAQSAKRYTRGWTYREAVPTASGTELFYVWERPHVRHFLDCVAQWYNVVVFTASSPAYASPIINHLDPTHRLIKRRYYRSDCTVLTPPASNSHSPNSEMASGGFCQTKPLPTAPSLSNLSQCSSTSSLPSVAPPTLPQRFGKDLSLLTAPLDSVVLLDNCPHATSLFPENSVLMDAFDPDSQSDTALLDILPFLEALSHVKDVRNILCYTLSNAGRAPTPL